MDLRVYTVDSDVVLYLPPSSLSLSLCLSHSRAHFLVVGKLLIDQHHQANVGRYVHQIRHETFIEPRHPFVPPSQLHTVPGTLVAVVLVLQTGPDHLVRIGGCRSDQLRNSGKR